MPPVDNFNASSSNATLEQLCNGITPRSPPAAAKYSRPYSPPDHSPPPQSILRTTHSIIYPSATPPPPPPSSLPPFASALSALRRTLSSRISLIPEDSAVHITSVNRDGFTYQYRRESPAGTSKMAIATTPFDSNELNAALLQQQQQRRQACAVLIVWRLLTWWPQLWFAVLCRIGWFVLIATQAERWALFVGLFATVCGAICNWPLAIVKHLLYVLHVPADERARPKRTVLISGGSTIQSLHLARNFQSAGFRVVVAEVAGRFALARFSTAVSRFYTLPAPPSATDVAETAKSFAHNRSNGSSFLIGSHQQQQGGNDATGDYIDALCAIADVERPVMYVPVAAVTAAKFDALVKPHLVLRECMTFCPGVQECSVLDDLAEVLHKCERLGMPVPAHRVVRSAAELLGLYDSGWVAEKRRGGRGRVLLHSMGGAAGVQELRRRHNGDPEPSDDEAHAYERYVELPSRRDDVAASVCEILTASEAISAAQPWLVLIEPAVAEHAVLYTCTTVRGSCVVANVTCRRVRPSAAANGAYEDFDPKEGSNSNGSFGHTNRIDGDPHRLRPDEVANKAVERWLSSFFGRVRFQRSIDGHFEFRLMETRGAKGATVLLPVGVRVGVPPAYICHTGVQSRVLMPPCSHFSRQTSGPLVLEGERYWVQDALAALMLHPTLRAFGRLLSGTLCDSGETLFVYWDPLPCVALYARQLPRLVARWYEGRK